MSENIISFIDEQGYEHIIIDKGNEEFISMPKSVYDEQQAKAEKDTIS